MAAEWTQARLEQYIADAIQENLNLDYKRSESLSKADKKKEEITKDVAAMANSDGGILIYGIKEYDEDEKRHLPERLDPIDQTQFTKEWLEQVVMTIRPRIDGLVIYPVQLDSASEHVAYVVDIPQSTTAHQSSDFRYHKRNNFMSVPMHDYEIRDVMGRQTQPKIELEFSIEIYTRTVTGDGYGFGYAPRLPFEEPKPPRVVTTAKLRISARNVGKAYAQYVNGFIDLPYDLTARSTRKHVDENKARIFDLTERRFYSLDNTVLDVVSSSMVGPGHGVKRHVPILPGLYQEWEFIGVNPLFRSMDWGEHVIRWSTHADNSHPNLGTIAIRDIPVEERTEE